MKIGDKVWVKRGVAFPNYEKGRIVGVISDDQCLVRCGRNCTRRFYNTEIIKRITLWSRIKDFWKEYS